MVTIKFSQLHEIAMAAEFWFNNQNKRTHNFNEEVVFTKKFKTELLKLMCDHEDEIFVDTLPF